MAKEWAAAPDPRGRAEIKAMGASVLVAALVDQLGLKLVAYLGGVHDVRTVRYWGEGTCALTRIGQIERLRFAFYVADMITSHTCIAVTQAWFQGLNPILGDVSPALMLRTGDIEEVGPKILTAAKQFIYVG